MSKTVVVIAVVLMAVAGGMYVMPAARDSTPRPPQPRRRPRSERQSGWGIEGRVINADGDPVAGVKVFAESDSANSSRVATGFTDEGGNFKIEVEGPGVYTVYGSKESDGYPLTISGFHQEGVGQIPKVTLAQNQVMRDVVVQLGRKAGHVEGVISDAATRRPIRKATITLRRADNPELCYIIGAAEEKENGRFSVLVPDVPFTIEVSAVGYEAWTYSTNGRDDRPEPLTVTRAETKKLVVRLRAKKEPL
jgi:hypothetical protein